MEWDGCVGLGSGVGWVCWFRKWSGMGVLVWEVEWDGYVGIGNGEGWVCWFRKWGGMGVLV